MAQKVTGYIRLQINAAKATASPPVGPALGQHGVNIAQFIKEFNERTKDQVGFKIPVVITVYADRSFTFITKTPPTATLIMKAVGVEKGSGEPNKNKVATITKAQLKEIAERKMPEATILWGTGHLLSAHLAHHNIIEKAHKIGEALLNHNGDHHLQDTAIKRPVADILMHVKTPLFRKCLTIIAQTAPISQVRFRIN